MENNKNKDTIIEFIEENGEKVSFNVIEETKINNIKYLLVTEEGEETDEETAYILKDMSDETSSEALYEMVEDDKELEYISNIFAELLDDIDLEK